MIGRGDNNWCGGVNCPSYVAAWARRHISRLAHKMGLHTTTGVRHPIVWRAKKGHTFKCTVCTPYLVPAAQLRCHWLSPNQNYHIEYKQHHPIHTERCTMLSWCIMLSWSLLPSEQVRRTALRANYPKQNFCEAILSQVS